MMQVTVVAPPCRSFVLGICIGARFTKMVDAKLFTFIHCRIDADSARIGQYFRSGRVHFPHRFADPKFRMVSSALFQHIQSTAFIGRRGSCNGDDSFVGVSISRNCTTGVDRCRLDHSSVANCETAGASVGRRSIVVQ